MKVCICGIAAAAALLAAGTAARAQGPLGVTIKGAPGGGANVLAVDPQGVGAAYGLEAGDVILAVNGHLVRRGAEAADLIVRAAGRVNLVVRKADGSHQQFDVEPPPAADRPRYQRSPGP